MRSSTMLGTALIIALAMPPSTLALPRRLVSLEGRDSVTTPTVSIKNGTLSGRYESQLSQDFFLNVPYAQPPNGNLRLAEPQPYNSTWEETRDASQWGSMCPGSGSLSGKPSALEEMFSYDEDCLNINIIRPSGTKKGDNLPVLFFIFGGGFARGTANDPRFNGSYLVQQSVENGEPIVFASINYRLSAFGFPANPSAALNLGLKDQRLALHWVQENIAEFGADPSKVTIWGQSAGGHAVALQMAAYGGRDDGLFRAAAIDSGISAGTNNSVATQAMGWLRFLNATGCDTDDQLGCLRALPYDNFYNAIIESKYTPSAVPDGDFIREYAYSAVANRRVVPVPFMIGATKDEASLGGVGQPIGLNNETAVRASLALRFGSVSITNETMDGLLEVYPDDNALGCPFDTGAGATSTGIQDKRTNAIATDQTHAGARKAAREMSYDVPVWSWRFNQIPQNNTIDQGASHGSELAYVYGVQGIERGLGTRPEDFSLSKTMQNYWLSFVNHLDPNASPSTKNVTKWEKYDESMSNMVFLNKGSEMVKDDYRKEGIEYIMKLGLGEA